ncbi:MAG TPA: alpha/beta hydrolase [Planktothrix sp.]
MDHFINIPVDHSGLIPDPRLAAIVTEAMSAPFEFTDIFIYSHGWWTTATDAMADYSRFSVEFLKTVSSISPTVITAGPKSSFGIGVHWPSTLSENTHEILNLFEPLTFYQMEKRSDDVGFNAVFALLMLMYQTRQNATQMRNFRLTLLGHSFGCRVVCKAVQRLFRELMKPTTNMDFRDFVASTPINVVLLQAAFADTDLQRDENYGDIIKLPQLRMLVTRSDLDLALKNLFPLAEHINFLSLRPGSRRAIGWAGPSAESRSEWNACELSLLPGYTPTQSFILDSESRMLVCDLTPIHRVSNFPSSPLKGHHSDIFLPEIYKLIAKFAFDNVADDKSCI